MVATAALLGLAVQLGTSRHFYMSALLSLFFGVTLASVVSIHFRVRPSWQDALSVIGAAALFTVIDFGFLHFKPSSAGIASFLGISSLSTLGLREWFAQLHAFVAHGMGFAGVVVFARAIELGARDGHGVCGVHDFRDDGDGGALFGRSRCRFSVRGVFEGIVRAGVAVERPGARDRVLARLVVDARMDRSASLCGQKSLDFARFALDLLRFDGRFGYFRAKKAGSGYRSVQNSRACSSKRRSRRGLLRFCERFGIPP
jgi:hypothetical protein